MTLAIILIVAAVLALVFILGLTLSRSRQLVRGGDAGRIQPIDIEAVRTLADPAEDDYLRRRLGAADVRRVRPERLLAMAAYVRVAGRNAAVLVRVGDSALAASDPHTAEAARQLVDNALLLRRNATLA